MWVGRKVEPLVGRLPELVVGGIEEGGDGGLGRAAVKRGGPRGEGDGQGGAGVSWQKKQKGQPSFWRHHNLELNMSLEYLQ